MARPIPLAAPVTIAARCSPIREVIPRSERAPLGPLGLVALVALQEGLDREALLGEPGAEHAEHQARADHVDEDEEDRYPEPDRDPAFMDVSREAVENKALRHDE